MSATYEKNGNAKGSFLMRLPNELLSIIAAELDTTDLSRMLRCNKRLNGLLTGFLYRHRVRPYLWTKSIPIKPGYYAYKSPVASWSNPRLTRTHRAFTPLEWAALSNQVTAIKRMIGYDPEPRVFQELKAGSAVELAAMVGNALALKALLETRLRRWPSRNWGCYPMHQAAFNGYLDAIQVLIDAGCPVDKRDKCKMSALAVATIREKAEAARLLLANGACRAKLDQSTQLRLHDLLGESTNDIDGTSDD